jgi:peptide/nickel transport system substrate-binding protein/oligopeptide transport system substrate-binding protein
MKKFLLLICAFTILSVQTYSDEKRELKIAWTSLEISYDPHHSFTTTEAQLFTAVYEGLVSYHPFTLEPLPGAASSWTISEDGRKYRFTINPAAKYWDGTSVTASDFRNAWLRLLKPEEKAEYSFLFDIIKGAKDYRSGKSRNADKISIKAVSDSVLEVELSSPASYFLKMLCHHTFSPIHPAMLKKGNWNDGTARPGNGAFYILEHTQQRIVLIKNQLYWDAKNVALDKIIIESHQDAELLTQKFNEGEIHWADADIILEKVADARSIIFHPMYATNYIFFNTKIKPWDNETIRQAVARLLPWEKIRENYLYPASTLVPQIAGYPELSGFTEQNIEEGLKLLEKAGYPEGEKLPELRIYFPEGQDALRVSNLIKKALEENTQIKVVTGMVPFQFYYEGLKKEKYAIGTTTWIGDFADPLTFLLMWLSDSNLNDSGLSIKTYDELIDKALKNTGQERFDIMVKAEKILLDSAAVLPLNNSPALNFIDLEIIEGWFPNPLDIHPFKYMKISGSRLPPGVVKNDSPGALSSAFF